MFLQTRKSMGKGPGSRGGKIIGHTKSGKAIYASKKVTYTTKTPHGQHHEWSDKDHDDARVAHLHAASHHAGLASEHGRTGNRKAQDYHNKLMNTHLKNESYHSNMKGLVSSPGYERPEKKKTVSRPRKPKPFHAEPIGEGKTTGKPIYHQSDLKRTEVRPEGRGTDPVENKFGLDHKNAIGFIANKYNPAFGWSIHQTTPEEKKEFGENSIRTLI
jgi:hypothetical protein